MFAPVVATFAPRQNGVHPNRLQVVPPAMPAYVAVQRVPLPQMTASSVIPAFPVSNVVRPPPLRLQLNPSPAEPVTSSFRTVRPVLTTNSVRLPLPPLQRHWQNVSRRLPVPVIQATSSATPLTVIPVPSVQNSVRPAPLRLCLSDNLQRTAGDFSCFTLSSTQPAVINRAGPAKKSTFSGCSLTAPSRPQPPKSYTINIIGIDDDSCSEQPADSDKLAATTASTAVLLGSVPPVIEVARSSLAASTSSTMSFESSPERPVVRVVSTTSRCNHVYAESSPVRDVIPTSVAATSSSTVHISSCQVQPVVEVGSNLDPRPVQPVIEIVPTAGGNNVDVEPSPVQGVVEVVTSCCAPTTSGSVSIESSPVQPVVKVIPTASSSNNVDVESGPVQGIIAVIPTFPAATTGSTFYVDSAVIKAAPTTRTGNESTTVQPVAEVVPSSSMASGTRAVHGRTAQRVLPGSNNHFQRINAGVSCLNHIFHYLDISSRLRAAQVCHSWHLVALHQRLVNSDRLFLTHIHTRSTALCPGLPG